jgi:hypothetical protein
MAKFQLNYEQANAFVEKNKKEGFFWDGWTIVKWSPSNNGFMQKNGMYRDGKWGYSNHYYYNSQGIWELTEKYAKLL